MKAKTALEKEDVFRITSNPYTSEADRLLTEMYDRIKAKGGQTEPSNTSDSNVVLLSYLAKSNAQETLTIESRSIDKLKDSLQRGRQTQQHLLFEGQAYGKKMKKFSHVQRFKTDFEQNDSASEIELLKRQNMLLKTRLATCQKRIINMQSFQQENEYLKKLCCIQTAQIQKLRGLLRNAKRSSLQNWEQQNKQYQSSSFFLNDKRCTRQAILINDYANTVDSYLHPEQKRKCSHKQKQERGNKLDNLLQKNSNIRNPPFHSRSKDETTKKNSIKLKKQKNHLR